VRGSDRGSRRDLGNTGRTLAGNRHDPGHRHQSSASESLFAGSALLCCDYSDQQIAEVVARLATLTPRPRRVVICNGILHQGEIQPEKRLEALNLDAMTRRYQTNALLPLRWISQLLPLFGREPCTLAVLSARVGSIGDNRAGGWYGYRAAKAALNMLLKCAAIELARRAPGVKLLAFHPGTVNTQLSRPFHAHVPVGNVQSPELVADQLVNLMNRMAN